MDRGNPYEAAFEAYLTAQGLCYVGVDEKKRSVLDDVPVKNLDFIVLGSLGARLLIDVKGRKFPGGPPEKQRRVWENWSTQEDILGLASWMRLFGPGYLGLFVFMYRFGPEAALDDDEGVWIWQETRYRLLGVPVDEYRRHMKVRSPRWGTVGLPGAVFRDLARPFSYFCNQRPNSHEGSFIHDQDQDRHFPEIARLAPEARPDGSPEAGGSGRRAGSDWGTGPAQS